MILKLRFLLCCLMTVRLTFAVDLDYYFNALRFKNVCHNITEKINCQIKCGEVTGMCFENKCYCLTMSNSKEYAVRGVRDVIASLLKGNEDGQKYSDFYDYNESPEIQYERRNADPAQDTPEYLDESLLNDKPILRHHIAHFCPNLDVARKCIRTCMEEGKPAFCGKDHICYCGHKYSNKDINSKADADSVYSQFRDLYEKYFGPNYQQQLQV